MNPIAIPSPAESTSPLPFPVGKAWYREPWPWLLFGIPAATAVAGVVTIALAAASFDGVVADDYYREGLAINRTLARDAQARSLGLAAAVQFNPEGTRVRVLIEPRPQSGAGLSLRVIHPSRGGADQAVKLVEAAPGVFEGALARAPDPGRWRLMVEDGARRWRLAGVARLPAEQPVELRAADTSEEAGTWAKRAE